MKKFSEFYWFLCTVSGVQQCADIAGGRMGAGIHCARDDPLIIDLTLRISMRVDAIARASDARPSCTGSSSVTMELFGKLCLQNCALILVLVPVTLCKIFHGQKHTCRSFLVALQPVHHVSYNLSTECSFNWIY